MATSKSPKAQGLMFSVNSPSYILQPRTPGTLGINDAADPNSIALPGDSPDPIGVIKTLNRLSDSSSFGHAISTMPSLLADIPLQPGPTGHSLKMQIKTPRDPNWTPPEPNFSPPDAKTRAMMFGTFKYKDAVNGDGIVITDGWDRNNIASVTIPEMKGIKLGWGTGISGGSIPFNIKVHKQLQNLFAAWRVAGVLSAILTFDGSFNARYMRHSKHTPANLSNHAWGTAFDLNAKWNPLSKLPAKIGSEGSVFDLVEIANAHGFYWGGHYKRRPDGMHFEVAKII